MELRSPKPVTREGYFTPTGTIPDWNAALTAISSIRSKTPEPNGNTSHQDRDEITVPRMLMLMQQEHTVHAGPGRFEDAP